MYTPSKRIALALAFGLLVAVLPSIGNAGSPSGRWKGEWISGVNGHHGPLRAHIRPTPNGDYKAVFAGRFFKVIPFAYGARLKPTGYPGHYQSVKRLPLIGEYRMSATITPSHFHAHFQSRKDHGVFDMRKR